MSGLEPAPSSSWREEVLLPSCPDRLQLPVGMSGDDAALNELFRPELWTGFASEELKERLRVRIERKRECGTVM